MRRPTLRLLAFVVLALLGAPVAMHVVLHDLHDHHDALVEADAAMIEHADHGEHEHPIVGSPAPASLRHVRTVAPVAMILAAAPATITHRAGAERNVLSLGALRIDDDVGLQPLLSTFLI